MLRIERVLRVALAGALAVPVAPAAAEASAMPVLDGVGLAPMTIEQVLAAALEAQLGIDIDDSRPEVEDHIGTRRRRQA